MRDTGPEFPKRNPGRHVVVWRGTLAQKKPTRGSGLGLPIVRGLVELHGGTFTLKSKVREGTEVIVVFPPERVMNACPASATETGAHGTRAPAATPATPIHLKPQAPVPLREKRGTR